MSTSHRSHKLALERAVAAQVGTHVGATEVVYGDAPDAILSLGDGRRVGLEVVSTVHSDWVQADRLTLEKLRPAIEKELRHRGVSCFIQFEIEVPEHFPPALIRDKQRRRKHHTWRTAVPSQVAALARRESGYFDRGQLEARGITGLMSLQVSPGPIVRALPTLRWSSAPAESLAEQLLSSKDAKLEGYRARFPDLAEFWLGIGPFGPGTVDDGGFAALMSRHFTTRFDRLFLVQTGSSGHAWEVTPNRATAT